MTNPDPTAAMDLAISAAKLPAGTRVLVAVSGGPDSIALLHALNRLKEAHGWVLRVGHVNHGLRGAESDADELFVRDATRALDLEIDVRTVDTLEYARAHHLSLESAARELRYGALFEMLETWRGEVIAIGHTEDDQAETVLLHLLRGAGLSGLGGMREHRGHVARPLLGISRQTILVYLQEHGVRYCLDSSNTDLRHIRNRIRLEVMPAITRINPSAGRLVGQAALLLQSDAEYLHREATRLLGAADLADGGDEAVASRGILRAVHSALRRGVLRALIHGLFGDTREIEARHLRLLEELIISRHQTAALEGQLPRGLSAYVDPQVLALRIGKREIEAPFDAVRVPIPGTVELPMGILASHILEPRSADELRALAAVQGPLHVLCDSEVIGASLLVRPRRTGDRMRPRGLGGSRKVQDILVDRHVPARERNRIPIVESNGMVVWIPGVAVGEQVSCTLDEGAKVHVRFMPKLPARAR